MHQIKCEHPNIIFAPNIVYLFSVTHRRVHLIDFDMDYSVTNRHCYHNFPWKSFYVAKHRCILNPALLDECYFIDVDGAITPVFIQVPCGHCRLCLERKTDEWETRCVCESACHPYPPLFVTLTYRPERRPSNMDDVFLDFQRFMKRLRTYTQRRTGHKSTIRYVAASEWTPKNHYPHIHLILWGMPFIPTTAEGQSSFRALLDFMQNDAWQNGIVNLQVARDTSGAYLLKYIRKGTAEDCWFKTSRRNGIGYLYAKTIADYMLKNPDSLSFSVRDRFSNKVHTYAIPAYFKRLWYPTLCVLFPPAVNKAVKDFCVASVCLSAAFHKLYPYRVEFLQHFDDDRYVISRRYALHKVDWTDFHPPFEFWRELMYYVSVRDSAVHLHKLGNRACPWDFDIYYTLSHADLLSLRCVHFRQLLISMFHLYRDSLSILQKYQYNAEYIKQRLAVTELHADYLRAFSEQSVETDIHALLHKARVDDDWRQTHWMCNPNT